MKRFYNHILSLLLLIVIGVTGAIAQNVQLDELLTLTTVEQVVSQDIFLSVKSPTEYPYYFMEDARLTSIIDEKNVFRFEETGKTSTDGYPTYYLKQVASNKYFEDYAIPDGDENSAEAPRPDDWGRDFTGLTADKAQAMELVICPFQTDNSSSLRDYATDGRKKYSTFGIGNYYTTENDLSFAGFVISRADYIKTYGSKYVQYLGHRGEPIYAIYQDCNVWHIYGTIKGKNLLLKYNEEYFPNGATLEELYPVGTEIGNYDQTYYDAANKVYTEFQAAINNYTLDDAAAQTLVDRLVEAMEALKTKGLNGFKPGYYYIHNMSNRTLYSQKVNDVDFLYASNTNYTRPAVPSLDDLKYIWRIDADRDANNALVMTNAASGKSISGVMAAVAGINEGYGFTLRKNGKVKVEFGTAAPAAGNPNKTFTFTSMDYNGNKAQKQFQAKYNDKAVIGWDASDAEDNNFYFTPVEGFTEELKEKFEKFYNVEQGEQTFHFKVDGVEYGSKTVNISSYLDIPTMSFLKNEDINRTSDGYDIICTEKDIPFVAQATFDANTAHWYALNINGESGNYLLSNKGGNTVSTTTISPENADVLEDAYLWAFVGNLKDGYRIYSKVDQKSLALYRQLMLKKGNGSIFKLYEKADASSFGLYVDEGKLLTRESEDKIVASAEDNNNDRSTFRIQDSKVYVINYAKPFISALTEAPENALWANSYMNNPENRAKYRALFLAANADDATNEQVAALGAENAKLENANLTIPIENGKYYRLYNAFSGKWLNVTLDAENKSTWYCYPDAEKSVASVVKIKKYAYEDYYDMEVKGLAIETSITITADGNKFFFSNNYGRSGYLGYHPVDLGPMPKHSADFNFDDKYDVTQWFVVPATEVEIAMSKVNEETYASAYLPFPVNGISGAKAYVGKLNDAKDMLNMKRVQGVAKNTGFVLVGDADKATLSIGETTETATSDLKGSNTNIALSSATTDYYEDYLVFGVNEDNVGFYAPSFFIETIPANKAYLETNQLATKAIAMNFGDNTTSIGNATVVANENAPIYDLSGRRVAKTVKGGVYIQNGKKFVK